MVDYENNFQAKIIVDITELKIQGKLIQTLNTEERVLRICSRNFTALEQQQHIFNKESLAVAWVITSFENEIKNVIFQIICDNLAIQTYFEV